MKGIPRFIAPLTFREVAAAIFSRRRFSSAGKGTVKVFADEFARYIGVSRAIPTPSGRVALSGLLHALGLKSGGEVILPALTFHSMSAVLVEHGLRPRFVDIDPSTYCIAPEKIEAAIGPDTVAIVPTHLYGRACDMEAIGRIAKARGLIVIEDCAQSCGGTYRGRRLGSLGDAAVFSFGPTKNLSALWAGMVTTNSDALAEGISSWIEDLARIPVGVLATRTVFAMAMRAVTRPWIWRLLMVPTLGMLARRGTDPIEALTTESSQKKEKADRASRLTPRDFQGRIGLGQLARLDASNRLRIRNGDRLRKRLAGVSGVEVPAASPTGENIYMSFPIRVNDRDAFRRRLLHLGVDTTTGYMSAGTDLPGFSEAGEGCMAVDAAARMVHLPVYPELEESDMDRIAEAVVRALAG